MHKTKQIKPWLNIIGIILLLSTCTGCIGSRETDQTAFVLAVGIDKLDNGQIEMTYTIANTLSFGNVSGSGQQAEPFVTISAKGGSPWESGNVVNNIVSRELVFMHTKAFIIGEQAARGGVNPYILTITRFREGRDNSSLYVCKGKAKDFLMNNKPRLESSPAKQFELIENTSRISGLFPVTSVHDFYYTLTNLHSSPITGLVGIGEKKEVEREKEMRQRVTDPLAEPYYAGILPRTADNKSEFIGTAVFNDDKMVGFLNGGETRLMLLLQGKFSSGIFNLNDPKHNNYHISLELRQAKNPEIIIKNSVDGIKIQATVFLEGEFLTIESGENYEEPKLKRQLEQYFCRAIEKKAQQLITKTKELNYGDIFHYDRYYRKELATWEEWEQLNWKELYNEAEINVICKTNIRRPGLMRKTEPILKEQP